jgi:hypothetical protein
VASITLTLFFFCKLRKKIKQKNQCDNLQKMNILFLSFVIKNIFFKTNVIGKLSTTSYIHDLELPSTKKNLYEKIKRITKGFIIAL